MVVNCPVFLINFPSGGSGFPEDGYESQPSPSISDILSENEQTIIMNSIKKIENFKGNLDDSDISFITKS